MNPAAQLAARIGIACYIQDKDKKPSAAVLTELMNSSKNKKDWEFCVKYFESKEHGELFVRTFMKLMTIGGLDFKVATRFLAVGCLLMEVDPSKFHSQIGEYPLKQFEEELKDLITGMRFVFEIGAPLKKKA